MNLWVSGHFLVAGLFLCVSALTPEECQPLTKPLSLADPSMLYGRTNFIVGYSNTDEYKAILKVTSSSLMNISLSAANSSELIVHQKSKINGTCISSTVNMTIDGNTATSSVANITSVFHMLPSCDGCLVFNIISIGRDLDKFVRLFNLDSIIGAGEIKTHALYLMGRESTLKDSDLEHFKQQASCLGFSGEPDYHHDPKNEFCEEGDGITITLA